MYDDILCAGSVLTRLPVGRLTSDTTAWNLGRSVWCWPLYGALIGCLAAAVTLLLRSVSVPPALAALWAVAVQLIVTGALHEDGLADFLDGIGHSGTREHKLVVMRDSRIGTFGTLALILNIGLRATALTVLPSGRLIAAMAATGALSRAVLPLMIRICAPARTDGLTRALVPLSNDRVCSSVFCGLCLTVLCVSGLHALMVTALALGLTAIMRHSALRLLGGFTGDVLGALACCVEAVLLTALSRVSFSL